jgi:hypothetical protein
MMGEDVDPTHVSKDLRGLKEGPFHDDGFSLPRQRQEGGGPVCQEIRQASREEKTQKKPGEPPGNRQKNHCEEKDPHESGQGENHPWVVGKGPVAQEDTQDEAQDQRYERTMHHVGMDPDSKNVRVGVTGEGEYRGRVRPFLSK